MQKIYIWSLPTRVFHFLFAFFILLVFISSEEDRWLSYHAIIGYAIFILLIFRLAWGIFGPKHSKFKDFPMGKKNIKEFLNNIFEDKQKYVGHNPIASYVMISMLVVCFFAVITGVLAYGIQEGKGIFAYLNSSFFEDMKLFKHIHEFLSTLFLVLLASHILGVISDRILHKKHETLNSIVTGYKKSENEQGIKLTIFQKFLAFIFLAILVSFFIFNIIKPNNVLIASTFKAVDYKKENPLFVSECASCHTLYPSKFIA
ncbi:cytochrome B561 [Arcobacter nitrofigilis DSM 7299]|uniref:Cytochrome B561 n=1 Tax=Arcobacter nitrofigilis (strain ATCC 33309 / DSM 7299 / CCUG 15893 / LMG 7604 / NCTC 12251 / CI) TaxID=572480 RepID=D5V814_ARCNC|nr:cytochrome b/b6 domain-containing protein [Arcobacter nitrofigilis]ADG94784.1 cytochrome B561 [Arcobacter nitrofigilis DSM 7299]